MSTSPKIIGLTGNIGSGKSTVAQIFAQYGWPVFDSDRAGKYVLHKNTSSFATIVKTFGQDILDIQGEIDRKKLADIVFDNPGNLERLNAIVHPAVRDIFDRWHNEQVSPFVIRETALLFETGIYKTSFKNMVVACPLEKRIQRVMQRNHISREKVMEREKNQWPEEKKIELADFVINNSESAVLPQVEKIIRQLEALVSPQVF